MSNTWLGWLGYLRLVRGLSGCTASACSSSQQQRKTALHNTDWQRDMPHLAGHKALLPTQQLCTRHVHPPLQVYDQSTPTWTCSVDEISIITTSFYVTCPQVADAQHTVVVNTTSSRHTPRLNYQYVLFPGTSATLVGLLLDGTTSTGTYAVDSGSPPSQVRAMSPEGHHSIRFYSLHRNSALQIILLL